MIGVAMMPQFGEIGMASPKAETASGRWLAFLGEFHPLFLHLPIGAVMLVVVMEIYGLMKKNKPQTTIALFFAAVTAIFAVVCGYMLYLTGEFEGELIEEHKDDGIVFTLVIIGTYLFKLTADRFSSKKALVPVYYIGLVGSVFTLIAAGHHGGEITHGDPLDIAPWKDKNKKGKEFVADPVIYTNIVHPILEEKCVYCHGDKKQKGSLRMDSYAALLEGGEEEECLVPGDLEKSAMITYLHKPLEDELHMPPEGKTQLTAGEIKILEWWVKSGAPKETKLSAVTVPADIQEALDSLIPPEEREKIRLAKLKAEEERKAKLASDKERLDAALLDIEKKLPGAVSFVSQQGIDLSLSALSYRKVFGDAELTSLEPIAENITIMDVSGTKISDKGAETLAKFPNLIELELYETEVSDSTLSAIKGLKNLQILNLHSTKITDQGLLKLYDLDSLQKVYLWNTGATKAGADKLQKHLREKHAQKEADLPKEKRTSVPQVIFGDV